MSRSTRLPYLILILVGCLVYFNSLFNGFIIGDDEDQILNNPLVHSLRYIPNLIAGSTYYSEPSQQGYGLFYRPVMMVSYALIYWLAGPDPLAFHLFQVSLHIINAWLIYQVLKKFFETIPSLLAALIFLIHPINSETVLYIANLQETLFLFFGLVGLRVLQKEKITISQLIILGLCLLLSLLSKETGVLFALIYGIYSWWYQPAKLRQLVICLSLVVTTYVAIRLLTVGFDSTLPDISQISRVSWQIRLVNVPSVISFYVSNFFWPHQLAIHQFWLYRSLTWSNFWLPIASILIAIILIKRAYQYTRQSSQTRKAFGFFSSWFLIGLLFHSQILPLYLTVATRWFYFPMIGLLGMGLAVFSVVRLKLIQRSLMLLIGVVIFLFAYQTYLRTWSWRDSETLLKTDLHQAPQDYYVQSLLATHYIRQKKFQQAQPLLEQSIGLHPYTGNLTNLGIVLMNQDKLDQAEAFFRQALNRQPTYQSIVNYINFLHYHRHRYDQVLELIETYLEYYPAGYDLWLTKAQAEYYLNKHQAALSSIEMAQSLQASQLGEVIYQAIKTQSQLEVDNLIE